MLPLPQIKRIFLSSTAEDLTEHRAQVAEAIERLDQATVRMETFGARPRAPVAECLRLAASADAVVVVVAHRYGWIPGSEQGGGEGKSITRLEVEAAREAKRPIFAFLVDETAPWAQPKEQDRLTQPLVLADPLRVQEVAAAVSGLQSFKRWIREDLGAVIDTFTTPTDLALKVIASLAREWLADPGDSGDLGAALLRERFPATLNALWARLRPVRLFATARQSADAPTVSIYSVYTALDVALSISLRRDDDVEEEEVGIKTAGQSLGMRLRAALAEDLEREAWARDGPVRDYHRRRVRALEAAAVAPRLVVVGAPGSGKSTFVQHLAVCLVGALLGKSEAHVGRLRERPTGAAGWMPWERRVILPIFVELADFTKSPSFPQADSDAEAGHLFEYLAAKSHGLGQKECEELQLYLAQQDGAGSLLILDGLDETFQAEITRDRLKRVISSFVARFPEARVIVTSRPYAYQPESPWRLDSEGFEQVELAPFSREQIRSFCWHWYEGMAEKQGVAANEVETRAEALWSELARESYLEPLAERPLMLTMLADVHAQQGALPSNRVELYEESTRLLLNRWNAAREAGRPGANRLTTELRIRLEDLRRAVEALAYQVQRDERHSPAARRRRVSPAEDRGRLLSAGQVIEVLRAYGGKGESDQILDFLHQRAGILVEEGADRFRFPHRSYQEYLAACHLKANQFPALLCLEATRDLERWREVVPLSLARVADTPHTAWTLVQALLEGGRDCPAEAQALRALLCARGLVESGLHERVEEQYREVLDSVRAALVESIEAGRLTIRDRADAGDRLGQLGDPRIGQSHWVLVPAGGFWMGAQGEHRNLAAYDPEAYCDELPVRRLELPAYQLGRYPITVAEYSAFIQAGGYAARDHWDSDGWSERSVHGWSCPENWSAQCRYPNRPVVGVSWYEARAYACWARARLPSEAEWEKAARGDTGTRYPWGDFESGSCNSWESGLRRITAVGIFPRGRSTYGVEDLSGNVWEWVEDDWRATYDDDPEQALPFVEQPRGPKRVLRGGSWYNFARDVRAAVRSADDPRDRDENLGFRIAREPECNAHPAPPC